MNLDSRLGQPLTPRERKALTMLAQGCSDEDIAAEEIRSIHTIKSRQKVLFAKLGVRSRAHAVAVGYQRGLIEDETGKLIAEILRDRVVDALLDKVLGDAS